MQMNKQGEEDPNSQWELVLIGQNEQEVGLEDSERLSLALAVNTPTEMISYLLVFAYPNPDGISLSEKFHPVGMPSLEESVVTAESDLSHRHTRLERLVYCVNRYLNIIRIDTSIFAHKCLVYSIVAAMSDELDLSFPGEMGYMDSVLPDPLLPPTYFGFGRLRHLYRANLLAFYCLQLWRNRDEVTILGANFKDILHYRQIDRIGTHVVELMQLVRAADDYYGAQRFDCL